MNSVPLRGFCPSFLGELREEDLGDSCPSALSLSPALFVLTSLGLHSPSIQCSLRVPLLPSLWGFSANASLPWVHSSVVAWDDLSMLRGAPQPPPPPAEADSGAHEAVYKDSAETVERQGGTCLLGSKSLTTS